MSLTSALTIQHHYTPLPTQPPCIRLCRIHKGDFGHPLRISLSIHEIQPLVGIGIETLSYVWGSLEPAHSIDCDGADISIQPNLFSALQHLRYPDRERVIWIDRLCINQADLEEKTSQVAMMSLIYSMSHATIWFGLPQEGWGIPWDVINRLNEDKLRRYQGLPDISEPWLHDSDLGARVHGFLNSPWYDRAWTFQEGILPRSATVQYGHESLPVDMPTGDDASRPSLTSFMLVLKYLVGERHELPRPFLDKQSNFAYSRAYSLIESRWDQRSGKEQKWKPTTLAQLLIGRAYCGATEARDKIYALLGVASDADSHGIEPNYRIPVITLFVTVGTYFARSIGLSRLLAFVNNDDSKTHGLPSWIPDWTQAQREFESGLEFPFKTSVRRFQAWQGGPAAYRISNSIEGGWKLEAKAIRVGSVSKLCSFARHRGRSDLDSCVLNNGEWHACAMTLSDDGTYKFTGEPISRAFARTRVADMWPTYYRAVPKDPEEDLRILTKLKLMHESVNHADNKEVSEERALALTALRDLVFEQTMRYALFVMDNGMLGLAPPGTSKDDEVYILEGCGLPCVLRARAGRYVFVGLAYVHGVMRGEWSGPEVQIIIH